MPPRGRGRYPQPPTQDGTPLRATTLAGGLSGSSWASCEVVRAGRAGSQCRRSCRLQRACSAPSYRVCRGPSERRHTAHEHLVEGRIYYRFHPRFGETVLIRRQLESRGVELVVVLQPDGSLACTPAWMTREAAAQYALSEKPRFSVDILRSLRAAADVLLRSLLSEPKTEKADNAAPIQKPATEPVRGRGASRRSGGRTDERSGGSGGSPAARDRDCTGEQGDRR